MEKETGMLLLQRKLAGYALREAGKGVPVARPYASGAGFGESGGGLVHGLYFGA